MSRISFAVLIQLLFIIVSFSGQIHSLSLRISSTGQTQLFSLRICPSHGQVHVLFLSNWSPGQEQLPLIYSWLPGQIHELLLMIENMLTLYHHWTQICCRNCKLFSDMKFRNHLGVISNKLLSKSCVCLESSILIINMCSVMKNTWEIYPIYLWPNSSKTT